MNNLPLYFLGEDENKFEIYFPESAWEKIKLFLLNKTHPVANLIKTYTFRYVNPAIFISRYIKIRNGEYKYSNKYQLNIGESPEKILGNNFHRYLKFKKILIKM